MPFVTRISSYYSEPWLAWVMLLLLALLLVGMLFQRGILRNSFSTLLATKERNSFFDDVSYSTYGRITLFVYQLLALSLALYAVISSRGVGFYFTEYAVTTAVVLAAVIVRLILNRWTAYVFFNRQTDALLNRHKSALLTVMTTLLYPVLLVIFYCPWISQTLGAAVLVILFLIYVILYVIKAFQLFFQKVVAAFYIFLYLCTLELVPVVCAYFGAKVLIECV